VPTGTRLRQGYGGQASVLPGYDVPTTDYEKLVALGILPAWSRDGSTTFIATVARRISGALECGDKRYPARHRFIKSQYGWPAGSRRSKGKEKRGKA